MSLTPASPHLGPRSNPLLRLLALNFATGVLVAMLAVGGLMMLDLFGLRRLMRLDQDPVLVVTVLLIGFIVTFSSVTMGAAVMMLGEAGADPEGRR